MQEFLSVGLAWVADAAGCLSWECCGIRAPQLSVRVWAGCEVLCPCLHDVFRHVLAFSRG